MTHVERLCWVGTQAPDDAAYAETIRFFRDVLGLRPVLELPQSTEFELPSGDRLQVYAPGGPLERSPVPLFEVDDVRAIRAQLQAQGFDAGDVESDSMWEWVHLRAPDGNDYELAQRRLA